MSYWVVILPYVNRLARNLTQRQQLVLDQVLPAKLISQKITDGGSAILKFKLSAITGPLLYISPYAAKIPLKIIKQPILNICVKNYRFKHTCNSENDIGRRKQQQLDYLIFTCKFPISSYLF